MHRLEATDLATLKDHHVEIPHRELSEAALRGVVESFVLREGTDYGGREFSFEEKIGAVIGQLDRGDAMIVFDADSGSIGIIAASPSSRRARPEEIERKRV